MRLLIVCVLLLLGTTAPAFGQAAAKPAAADLKTEVRGFVKEYVKSVNEGDFSTVAELYVQDPDVATINDGEVTRGYDAIRKELDGALGLEGKYKLSLAAIDVSLLGPNYALAFASYNMNLKVDAADPKAEANVKGALSILLKKTSAGWRILHEHMSTVGEPAETEGD